MSYTTRCPACGTTFKVVPDQLKISDGWVRCGYCSDVFDASLYLQPWEESRKGGQPAAGQKSPVSAEESAPVGSAAARPRTQVVSGPAPSARPRIPESQVAPSSVVAALKQQQSRAAGAGGSDRKPVGASLPPSASQFLSSPDPKAAVSARASAGPSPGKPEEPAGANKDKEARKLAEQNDELKPDPADDWGDSDFMAELKRYADEVRAEDEAEAKAAQVAKAAEPDAPRPRAKPAELPPLPPVAGHFRPRPQRLIRDPRNERHAADDIYSAVPPPPEGNDAEEATPSTQEKAAGTKNTPPTSSDSVLPPVAAGKAPGSKSGSVAKEEVAPDVAAPTSAVEKAKAPAARALAPESDKAEASDSSDDTDEIDSEWPLEERDETEDEDGTLATASSPARGLPPARNKSKRETDEDEDEVPLAEDDVSSRLMEEGVELSFVQQARRKAFWESRAVRMSMVALVLLLGMALAGQWAIQERNELAAARPAIKPLLVSACGVLGCEVGAARRIDQVVIERANLQRRLDNLYSFDFEIRNTSDIPLAAPAVELSLTGSEGASQVIARRVFLPQEWPGQPEEVPAGKSISVSLSLTLAGGQDLASAGFRAFVFYP
ncbi:DUF3426 domain-containing protein [Hydrogenophaga sp. 5NK40-0174]|uniref:DUF3426 domain-containing protein n=1 Tax=Hydrogenophaga sp. 5NK40-0174 TaxID=3127649 RepID=UPI0031096613